MPISRYHIRSEYSLSDPELHRRPENDDPETLLEAVSMAGLVGFLRQLGDLAQFATEIFHDLHEEVVATTARGHSLMSRVQQLEAEVPALEKAFLSQTHHPLFFTSGGIDWHPNLRSEQNLVTRGDMPRFIMDTYEECRGTPRLFLLDKFDVAGAGACLKRYTDPSFFKVDSASSGTAKVEVRREKKVHKVKQKKGALLRNGETPGVAPSHAKLHQLFLEERIENAYSDPARLVKLKKKQLNGSAVEAKTGKSYMEKVLDIPSPDHKMVCETSTTPLPMKLVSDDTSETGIKILEISSITPMKRSLRNESASSSPNELELELKSYSEMDRGTNGDLVKVHEQISAGVIDEMSSNHLMVPDETEIAVDGQKKMECSLDGYHSDDVTCEVDDYMDALATIESDLETENECRPKKSLLNIQQLTDSKGKEEHQLQARFSDSQSFGDSSTADEISSFKQDRNGEHTDVLSRLSYSQTTGASSASDDISSFRRDRNDEHTQFQAQFSDSQSIGNSKSEIEDMPSNQLPQTVELQKTYCGEFVMHEDAHVQGEEISDYRQVSSGSCVMDSGHLLLSSDHGPTTSVSLPTETKSDETPSGPVELHLKLEDEEDRKCLVESIVAIPDACPVVSSDDNSLNNLDVCVSYVHSNDLSQVSNDLNLAHEDECDVHSEIQVLQAESPNECPSEVLVSGDIGPQSEGTVCQDLKSEDGILATQLNSEDLSPVVETPPVSSFTEGLCNDFTLRNPPDEPGSAEVKVSYSDPQSNFEEVHRMIHGHGISKSTCSVDLVKDDDHIKHPPSPGYISEDNRVMVNDMFKKVPSENQAVSAIPSVGSAETAIPSNSQETLPGSSDSHLMEVESNELALTKISIDMNAEKRENQLKPSLDIISSPMSNLTGLEESLSTFADPHEKEIDINEAVARESLTELAAQKVVDQPEIASSDVQSNLNTSVPCDLSDSEICNNIQDSSLKEKIQYGSYINDMKMVPICSELDSQRSDFLCQNDLQNSKDNLSSPSYNQLEPETHLEQFLQSQVGQQDAGFVLRNEEYYTSDKFQLQQMQLSNQLEQERISHAASEFAPEIHPDEPSSCDSLSKSSGQEINPTKHGMDPLKPLLPDLFPKATKIDFEEMPPMPPLPPMQWRTGKAQHDSLVSPKEEIEVSQATFQPIQPVKPDDKSLFGLSTSERETLLYQNPFLSVMDVESNKRQHSPGFSTGVSEHPVAIPLQFPIMVNEANGQYNYLLLERSQIQNPFLTLPMVSTGWPAHGYVLASEREMVQNSNPCSPSPPSECAVSEGDPISPHEKLTRSPCQSIEETSFEVGTLQQSSINLEREQGDPSISPVSPPSIEVVQPNHSLLPPECAVSGGDPISPQEKPTQSPSQSMEETSLEVKTLQQPLINLEREQGDPSISPVSPPIKEIVQPNHSLLPSEGAMALSLETSAQTQEFDSEMANGKPKNKLPRPTNPLFDPVAAIDKSKLRKVTDRVRPQLAPKVDERDSLLEQIRTKSFNLKPAVASRPNIQGPRTNLRVAAILEKANAIRQALAGSEEDDDADSWSDS